MNSALTSIGWELLARRRWATALVALSFLVSYSLNLLWPNLARSVRDPVTGDHEGGWLMPVEFVAFLLSMAALFWIFSYAEPDRRGRQGGFPSRQFVLPLRTIQLVAMPTILGALAVTLFYSLWAGLIFAQWDVGLSLSLFRRQLLTVVAMLLVTQALVWSFHAFPWIRLILLSGLLVVLWGFGFTEFDPRKISDAEVFLILGVVIAVAATGAVAGVARDRRGSWEGWTGKLLQRIRDALPERRREFASAAQAQFWCEWQRKGWFLSLLLALPVAISIVLFLIPSSLLLVDARAGFVLCAPAILLLVIASSVGGSISKSDLWAGQLGFSFFAATRPITTGELVIAKLKVTALVLLAGWGIIVALSPLAFNTPRWLLPGEFPLATWTELKQQYPTFVSLLCNPVLYVAVFSLSWQSAVAGLSIALLARPNKVLPLSFLSLVIFMSMMSGGAWLLEHPQLQSVFFPALIFGAVVLALIKGVAALKAFRDVHEQSLLLPPHFVAAVSLWCIAAAGIGAGAWLLRYYAILPGPMLLFLTAYFLPGTELPNCALHLARDRHR